MSTTESPVKDYFMTRWIKIAYAALALNLLGSPEARSEMYTVVELCHKEDMCSQLFLPPWPGIEISDREKGYYIKYESKNFKLSGFFNHERQENAHERCSERMKALENSREIEDFEVVDMYLDSRPVLRFYASFIQKGELVTYSISCTYNQFEVDGSYHLTAIESTSRINDDVVSTLDAMDLMLELIKKLRLE